MGGAIALFQKILSHLVLLATLAGIILPWVITGKKGEKKKLTDGSKVWISVISFLIFFPTLVLVSISYWL